MRTGAAVLVITLIAATPCAIAADRGHVLDVVNRVPRFEKFYADAQGLTETAR